ncbi:pyrroline-5-carboxylate reductase [Legionella sp.]|uniref:pyrroline-5-carboxylate reductase n=1 Tax=Legionella sp. TaxID=459 RepID=UPI003CA8D755
MTKSISIIGAGHLGNALIRGLIKNAYPQQCINVSNRNPNKLTRLVNELGVIAADTNIKAAENGDILILCVKPQVMRTICLEIATTVRKKSPLIISLAAVTEITSIAQWLGTKDLPIARVMANTPMEFCKGISALFANEYVTAAHKLLIEAIFGAVGSFFWVDQEQLLDPLTAAIGSAPAYVFLFMEALQNAAMNQKIPEKIAKKIALDVVTGAVVLAEQSGQSFAKLRAGVTTPNGITEHSLRELSIELFIDSFREVYQAANQRIKQIKEEF